MSNIDPWNTNNYHDDHSHHMQLQQSSQLQQQSIDHQLSLHHLQQPQQSHQTQPSQQLLHLQQQQPQHSQQQPPPPPPPPQPQQQQQLQVNPPPSVDACSNIVQSLLNHSCGDVDFCRRAIESLVKKMKEKREELDALITSIKTSGAVVTQCVTIQRTLDGRLQVAGRKGFPQYIYAKIWRWPDLARNELRPNKICANGFQSKSDLICVNPYHYDRVVATPGQNWELSGITGSPFEDSNNLEAQLGPSMAGGNLAYSVHDMDSPSNLNTSPKILGAPLMPISAPLHPPMNIPVVPNTPIPMSISHQHPPPLSVSQPQVSPQSQQLQQEQHHVNQHHQQLPPITMTTPPNHAVAPMREHHNSYLNIPTPRYWCAIDYFELDQKVGETFRVSSRFSGVTIDGYTAPSVDDRFCIGFLSTNHRTPDVIKARLHIGRGVRLEVEEGDVWLENQSDNAVFLNSPYLDQQSQRTIGEVVHKIYPRAKLKVFDLHEIHMMLSERAEAARQAATAQAAAVAGTGNVGPTSSDQLAAAAAIGVDDLRRYCVLSMSFVKGWGLDYKRKSIKNCPCWVEVTMNRALQVLDDLLRYKL